MPGRRRRRISQIESDTSSESSQESDDNDIAMSQAISQSHQIGVLSDHDRMQALGDLCRIMMFAHASKDVITMKVLNEKVFKASRAFRNAKHDLIREAIEQLERIFGYKVVDLSDVDVSELHISSSAFSGANKSWLVLNHENNLPGSNAKMLADDVLVFPEIHFTAFRMTVLAIIFLARGEISESSFWSKLSLIGLASTINHEHLGNIGVLVKTMEKQKYINRFKSQKLQENRDEPTPYMYEWGVRAQLETDHYRVYKYIARGLQKQSLNPSVIADFKRRGLEVDDNDLLEGNDTTNDENNQENRNPNLGDSNKKRRRLRNSDMDEKRDENSSQENQNPNLGDSNKKRRRSSRRRV